jgi:hypothetical protein
MISVRLSIHPHLDDQRRNEGDYPDHPDGITDPEKIRDNAGNDGTYGIAQVAPEPEYPYSGPFAGDKQIREDSMSHPSSLPSLHFGDQEEFAR